MLASLFGIIQLSTSRKASERKFKMALTRISVTLLLLVGIMSVAFAAPDQTAELEKTNENGDAQDVSVAAERPD